MCRQHPVGAIDKRLAKNCHTFESIYEEKEKRGLRKRLKDNLKRRY